MKKLIVIFIVLICAPAAWSYSNSGTLLGVFAGNDSNQDLETLLGIDILGYAKNDGGVQSGDFPLYVTYAADYKSGTWATYAPPPPAPADAVLVDIYIVKAGNWFAAYDQNPDASSGTWSTVDLLGYIGNGEQIPTISHLSAISTQPVPEPATMLLLGAGLLGLAGYGRRKLQ